MARTRQTARKVATRAPVTPTVNPDLVRAREVLEQVSTAVQSGTADDATLLALLTTATEQSILDQHPLHSLTRPHLDARQPQPDRFEKKAMAELLLRAFGSEKLLEQEHEGCTPLGRACRNNDLGAARFFLDAGADITTKVVASDGRRLALLEAAGSAFAGPEVINLLLARGADPNKRQEWSDLVPLVGMVREAASRDVFDETALATVKALMDHTARWIDCDFLFRIVCQGKHLDLLKLLLSYDDQLKEYSPPTSNAALDKHPLMALISAHKPVEWFELVLANGHKFAQPIDLSALDALNAALKSDKLCDEVIGVLIKYGADVRKAAADTGETPIMLASRYSSKAVLQMLLAAGADLHATDAFGRGVLHATVMDHRVKRFKRFFDQGVDPLRKDVAGNSVYIYALVYGAWWAVTHLIDHVRHPPIGDDHLGEPWWLEERVQWKLRRPITQAMKDRLDALRSRDDARIEAAPLADDQQLDIINTLCDLGSDSDDMVEVVTDDEWAERNAKHEALRQATGDQFERQRGVSPLLLFVKADLLVKRAVALRPDLALREETVVLDGAKVTTTPLEESAGKGHCLVHILSALKLKGVVVPPDLRQKVMHKLFASDYIPGWTESLGVLPLLGTVDLNEPDPKSGLTLLHRAVASGDEESMGTLAALLRLGADLEAKDRYGKTPLLLCTDCEPALQLLLAAGANVDIIYSRKACSAGQEESTKKKKKKQRDTKQKAKEGNKESALAFIAKHFDEDTAETVATYAPLSPAHVYYLIRDGRWAVASTLLLRLHREGKAREYLERPDHKSPLWALVKSKEPKDNSHRKPSFPSVFTKAVRDFKYNPGRSKHGRSLLWEALTRRRQLSSEVMQLVLRHSAADLCTINDQGESCLDVALQTGNVALLDAIHDLVKSNDRQGDELLLREQVQAMVQKKNARGQTTLMAAIRRFSFASCANVPLVSKLVEMGVDVNEAEAETGNTALFYAATTNSIPLCEKLVAHGADVNARNHAGETPLFAAGRRNHWHTTLYLLQRGADPHAMNKAGECALVASSALCAAIIHDFVTRPHSLAFISGRLLPLLCPDIQLPSQLPSQPQPELQPQLQLQPLPQLQLQPLPQPRATASPPADPMVVEAQADSSAEPAPPPLKPLVDYFPELVPSDQATRRKVVARVTELLERVLETMQLYQGAPSDADPTSAPRADGESDPDTDRRVRWERNESLAGLKTQLAGWLRASQARIPRITRNLSFSTLSENEMALYLRQWKALQQQKLQARKRKREGNDDAAGPSPAEEESQQSQGLDDAEHTIDVKRPRLTSSDDDLPAEPQLVVPDLDTIPLPPPFIPEALARSLQGDERRRAVSVVERTAVVSSPSKGPMVEALRCTAMGNVALWDVGLLDDDEGYLLDAFLMRLTSASAGQHQPSTIVLQALVAVHSDAIAKWNAATTATKNESGSESDKREKAKEEEKDQMETEGEGAGKRADEDAGLIYYGVWEKGRDATPQLFVAREEAVAEFERRFKAHTGNAWAERQHQHRYIQRQRPPSTHGVEPSSGPFNSDSTTTATTTTTTAPTPTMTAGADVAATTATTTTTLAQQSEAEVEPEFLYLPTNHEAVCEQLNHSGGVKNDEVERVKAALPAPGDVDTRSDEQRVFDLLSFVSNKHQIFGYCQRVGLLKVATLGQLTATQLKNASNILDVISGILAYEDELKRLSRPLPPHIVQARQNLSHMFHCVLPFDLSVSNIKLPEVIDTRHKLAQKADILQARTLYPYRRRTVPQSLQEIGIGLEVLHEVSLPHKHGDEEEAEEEGAEVTLDERADEPLKADDQRTALARMRLLCHALKAKLTPLDKQSDEWRMIGEVMKDKPAEVIDAFAVERMGEEERYRPYANLPHRTLLGHGTGVANVMGILRKGLCIRPIGAKTSGATFGPGIYFSDLPDKSLNYMKLDSQVGCFLLCEVALGEGLIRRTTRRGTTLPPGRHHYLGLGKSVADPHQSLHTDEGVTVPLGKVEDGQGRGYNEFVIPNEDQVRIRYLLLLSR